MPQKKKGGKKKKQSKQSKKGGKSNTDALSEETGENNNENNTSEEETTPVPRKVISKDEIISAGRDLILEALKTGGEAKAATLHFVGSPKCSNPACDIGEAEVKLKTCSRCHNAMYCSVECQRKHWAEHKPLCKHIQNVTRQTILNNGLEEKIFPKRITRNTLHPHIIAELKRAKSF